MLSQFNGAIFDNYRQYRFLLWRFWDDRPKMLFVGLNPSTANELEDDPTIRRLCNFARSLGYGGLYACNVFSRITPYPSELKAGTAIHPADTHALKMVSELVVLSVCGWGDGIERADYGISRANTIKEYLKVPMCFGLTSRGNPKHPLYLRKDAELEEYGV